MITVKRSPGTLSLVSSNPFATDTAARIYAAGRPDYSDRVTGIILKLLGNEVPFRRAVDVGSGTGISTMALAPLAEEVIGVEVSPAMVERARSARNVTYRLGAAEDLPLEDDACDLIGVGSAVHWFDQERFLAEAGRVATVDAWLVVHDHWFTAQMRDDATFTRWFRDRYLSRFPSPPKDRSWRPPDDLGAWGHLAWERYEHPVKFDQAGLADYLLTQSNLQTVMERGDMTEVALREWLASELDPFLATGDRATFVFGGYVACHTRSP